MTSMALESVTYSGTVLDTLIIDPDFEDVSLLAEMKFQSSEYHIGFGRKTIKK
jgi:hypothetical protein